MDILGSILKRAVDIRGKIPKRSNFDVQQKKVLKKLLKKAEFTAFGEHFHFTKLLQEKNDSIIKENGFLKSALFSGSIILILVIGISIYNHSKKLNSNDKQ